MKRREFIRGTILTGSAGMILEACTPTGSEQVIPVLIPEEQFVPGAEEFLATACPECAGGCGLLARKIDGRIVKVEGNPEHPISRGGTCARGQALPQSLYHPDRVRQPLIRDGERGQGGWREASWDEAIDRVVEELSAMRAGDEASSLAMLTGALRGHRPEIVRRFLAAFGSARHLVHEPLGDAAVRRANAAVTGVPGFFAYDLERARYVVSFGAQLIEGSRSPVRYGRGLAHMRRGRPGIRGKLVAVEPRLSLTASSADQWLAARPGTEGAVALAMAHVIVRDGLYDDAFVAQRTTGFERLRDEVLPRFAPEAVASAADVPAEAIERVAHEMAEHGPAVVLTGDAAAGGATGLATALAVDHLNALLGAYGAEGGVYFDPPLPFAPWPDLPAGTQESAPGASPGESAATGDATGATGAGAPPGGSFAGWLARRQAGTADTIGALLIAGANPVHSAPKALDPAGAIGSVPFVVSFASVLDETAMLADVVLPESSPFERFDDDVASPGVGVPVATLSRPLFTRTLFDTRSMPDALIAVASGLGGDMADAFPWESYEMALRDAWAGLQATGTGSVTASSAAGFWRRALTAGGWWDESAIRGAEFRTPDARYRFEVGPIAELAVGTAETSSDYPLTLQVHGSVAFGDGRSAHLPFLQELPDPMTGARWGTRIELNPATGAAQDIEDGDIVVVASAHGAITAAARLTPGIRPDVVAVAAGQGHTTYGRFATGRGANPFALLGPEVDDASGEAALVAAVRLRRISMGQGRS